MTIESRRWRDGAHSALYRPFFGFGRESVDLDHENAPAALWRPPAAAQKPVSPHRSVGGWPTSFPIDRFLRSPSCWVVFLGGEGRAGMVCGALSVPACGDSITEGEPACRGNPKGAPRSFPRAVFCILFLCFRARARGTAANAVLVRLSAVFRGRSIPTFSGFNPTFSGRVLHFPGAIHSAHESYPQVGEKGALCLSVQWFFPLTNGE